MKIAKTTYEKLGYQDCPRCFPGEIVEVTEEEILDYLVSDPNSVVLVKADDGFIALDLEGACSFTLNEGRFLCYALARNYSSNTEVANLLGSPL